MHMHMHMQMSMCMHMGMQMCTCACHVTCDVCAHVSENGGLGFEVVTRVAKSTHHKVGSGQDFFELANRFLFYFSRARVDIILIYFSPAYIYTIYYQPSSQPAAK